MAICLIEAPTNLGLKPPAPGREPGCWRMPEALSEAGLRELHEVACVRSVPRPCYRADQEAGSSVRNASAIREFTLLLAEHVSRTLSESHFPLVVGGDCSCLLGCLLGARRHVSRLGLVHIDGHADFGHPGNMSAAVGNAAGMDLALATGRGEAVLTQWSGISGPLVAEADSIHVGERESELPDYAHSDIFNSAIDVTTMHKALAHSPLELAEITLDKIGSKGLTQCWLHVDLDALDQSVMPAVDCPGSPGFDFDFLAAFMGRLLKSPHFIGLNVTIYDPDLDPDLRHAQRIVEMLGDILGEVASRP